jgi:molecular chaperone GrpE
MQADENYEETNLESGFEQADDALAIVTRERDELKDQILRVQAEFQNALRRERSMIDVRKAEAVGAVARDVLDVMDNFDRALESARSGGPGSASIVSGLELVHKQLLVAFAKHKVVPIESQDLPFNPDEHEAVMQRPSSDHPDGTVIQVLAQGYKLGDRVLRPSKVVVSIAD